LNEKIFDSDISPDSITTQCACNSRDFGDKRLLVVDTPGFLDTNITEEGVQREVAKSYQMTAEPGPHAFLLVLEPARFTDQEAKAVEYLSKIFDTKAINHTILIFTHGDEFTRTGSTVERYLGRLKPDHPLKKLLDACNNRYLSVNNVGTDEEKQRTVELLLDMITNMVEQNDGQVYRSDNFDAVAKIIDMEKSKGTYYPFRSDGTYLLLDGTEKIVVEGFLRRTVGRRNAF